MSQIIARTMSPVIMPIINPYIAPKTAITTDMDSAAGTTGMLVSSNPLAASANISFSPPIFGMRML